MMVLCQVLKTHKIGRIKTMSDNKKKLLGLNFGRANGNCKKFLNKAIEAARAENPEVEIEVIDCMKYTFWFRRQMLRQKNQSDNITQMSALK